MASKEEIRKTLREVFIAKDGDKFLKLAPKDQENIISAVIIGYIERKEQSSI